MLLLMRTPSPPPLPLLRSQAQGELLALLYLHPEREYSLTEAAGRSGHRATSVKVRERLPVLGWHRSTLLSAIRPTARPRPPVEHRSSYRLGEKAEAWAHRRPQRGLSHRCCCQRSGQSVN